MKADAAAPEVILVTEHDLQLFGGAEGLWKAYLTLKQTPAGQATGSAMPDVQLKYTSVGSGAGALALAAPWRRCRRHESGGSAPPSRADDVAGGVAGTAGCGAGPFVGPLRLPPLEVMQALAVKLGPPRSAGGQPRPRRGLAAAHSACLAGRDGGCIAGDGRCQPQGLFGNPLADPGIVGVSQGAALARGRHRASAAGAAGWLVPVAAFVGGALAIGLTCAGATR